MGVYAERENDGPTGYAAPAERVGDTEARPADLPGPGDRRRMALHGGTVRSGDVMPLSADTHGRRILMMCAAFLLLGPWWIWSTRAEYRQAVARHAALEGAAVAEYVVDGRDSEVRGSGKQRRTHYFLHVARGDRANTGGYIVEVSETAYERTADGEVWTARLDGVQPVFDPLQTRLEYDRSRTGRIGGLTVLALAVVVFLLHRSGRLYRPLW